MNLDLDAHPASHWNNSAFMLEHFLLGRAHTPDEKYRVLCCQRENRVLALNAARVAMMRAQARRRRWRLLAWIPYFGLAARAALLEQDLAAAHQAQLVDGAVQELQTIDHAIARVFEQRKYKDLPNDIAHQFAQREQWALELMTRAENYLFSQGWIPANEIEAMRAHPEWESAIGPHLAMVSGVFNMYRNNGLVPPIGRNLIKFVPPPPEPAPPQITH